MSTENNLYSPENKTGKDESKNLTSEELQEATEQYTVDKEDEETDQMTELSPEEKTELIDKAFREGREQFNSRYDNYIDALDDAEDFNELCAVVQSYAIKNEHFNDGTVVEKKSVKNRKVFGEPHNSLQSSLYNTLRAIRDVEGGDSLQSKGGSIVGEKLWDKVSELAEAAKQKQEVGQ